MSRRRWLLPLLIFVLFAAFNNCTKSDLKGVGYVDSSSNTHEGELLEPHCKTTALKLNSDANAPQTKVADVILNNSSKTVAAGERLLVLVDNECYKNKAGESWLTSQLKSQGFEINNATSTATTLVIQNEVSVSELQANIERDSCILTVDKEVTFKIQSTTNDPYYLPTEAGQPYLYNINHDLLWSKLFNSANGINRTVRVAVMDSGIDVNHPDLQGLLLRDLQNNLIALNGIDNNNDVLDTGFHGTHVTGLIAAIANNGQGISGVLGQNVKILPIKASLDGVSVNSSAVVNGIRWAADNGADIINMSLGGSSGSQVLRDAIDYAIKKNVTIVVAAGNGNSSGVGQALNLSFPVYPAMYSVDFNGMITVGALDLSTLAKSGFSNYSSTYVDIFAPGSNGSNGILSTVPANLSPSGYARLVNGGPIHGTSMAAPMTTGAAAMVIALARSRGYDVLPSQVEELFVKASPTNNGFLSFSNSGHVLDLQALANKIDLDTHLDLSSTADRSLAYGSVAIATQPQNVIVNENDPFTLAVTKSASSSIFINYQWYKNGVAINGANQPTFSIPKALSVYGGTYKVQLKAGSSSVMSQEVSVTVNPINENCF